MSTFYYILSKNIILSIFYEKLTNDGKGVRDPLLGSQPLSTEGALRAVSPLPEELDESSIRYVTRRDAVNEVEALDIKMLLITENRIPVHLKKLQIFTILQSIFKIDTNDTIPSQQNKCKLNEISTIIRDYVDASQYNIYFRMITAIYECNYPTTVITAKFKYLSNLLNNMFYTEDDKEQFQIIFGKAYQIYRGFSLLARLYRIKKIPPHNTFDLVLNPFIPNFNDLHSIIKHTKQQPFMLIQNGAKYFFSRVDLIRLLNTSLGNTFDFFAKPLVCSNPYNKIAFAYHDLYNIYFYIKDGHMKISQLIDAYHDCGFVLEKFVLEKEYIIREYAIKEYIINHPDDELYDDIIDMIDEHCPTITIHTDFPWKKLIFIMKPYLYLYFISLYSLIPSKKNKYRKLFKQKIQDFNTFNPSFGRKVVHTARSMFGDLIEGQPVTIRFIDNCIPLLLSEVM
jgi:hypothetical protein